MFFADMLNRRQLIPAIAIGTALIAVLAWAYSPSLPTGFLFDDNVNLQHNPALHPEVWTPLRLWEATWSFGGGGPGRPVAMLSFALEAMLTGLDPFFMRITNITIHVATGVTLFLISVGLLSHLYPGISRKQRMALAVFATAAWLLHPINFTAVGYLVQRMTSLAGLLIALAVLVYVRLRLRQQSDSPSVVAPTAWIVILGLMALLSKEIGVLLVVYLFVVETIVFRFRAANPRTSTALKSIWIGGLGLGALATVTSLLVLPDFFGAYDNRPFTMVERLMTEARILVWYVVMILVPDLRQFSLYLDNIPLSTGLLSPPTTLLSVLALGTAVLAALAIRRKIPLLSFGIAWFLGGHLLESTVLPLELAYEHRNYLPSFGIVLAVVALVHRAFVSGLLRPAVAVFGTILVCGVLAGLTHARASYWSNPLAMSVSEAERRPDSPRAQIEAGNTYSFLAAQANDNAEKHNFLALAEHHMRRAHELAPDSAAPLLGILLAYGENRVPPPAGLIDETKRALSTATMDASTSNALLSLSQCKLRGACELTDQQYEGIVDAAFDNPTTRGLYSANILYDMATYYGQHKNDPLAAAQLLKRATEEAPRHVSFRIDLAVQLARVGRFDDALEELSVARRLDRLCRKCSTIASVRQAVLELRQARTHDPIQNDFGYLAREE